MRRAVLLLLVIVVCGGCAVVEDRVHLDLGKPTFFTDQWTRREPPAVYVYPTDARDSVASVLFVPFRVTQKITDPEMIGYATSRTVYQTWLSMELFPAMEYLADQDPFRRDRALALARAKGADLVVGGFVTYYLSGGSMTDSQISIQVEIYDARSGELICSMAQGALMPARDSHDYIIFASKTRLPSDPMFVMTRTMAEDMGTLLAGWFGSGADSGTAGAGSTAGQAGQGAERRPEARPAF